MHRSCSGHIAAIQLAAVMQRSYSDYIADSGHVAVIQLAVVMLLVAVTDHSGAQQRSYSDHRRLFPLYCLHHTPTQYTFCVRGLKRLSFLHSLAAVMQRSNISHIGGSGHAAGSDHIVIILLAAVMGRLCTWLHTIIFLPQKITRFAVITPTFNRKMDKHFLFRYFSFQNIPYLLTFSVPGIIAPSPHLRLRRYEQKCLFTAPPDLSKLIGTHLTILLQLTTSRLSVLYSIPLCYSRIRSTYRN